ncbi:MAG: Stf0 sulfotransferase family protein [Gammaproteobacteria bacterium]|jgi:LPS sulfotransferase NodH|nr:Stf0 sulfotransferase family protein [Gammaproteobacteria bacterium]
MLPALLAGLDTGLYPAQCEHQQEIESHFGDATYRPLLPLEQEQLQSLRLHVVAFSNRSGSTLLTSLLHQAGAGVPPRAEVFNSDSVIAVAQEHGIHSFTDYFLQVVLGWAHNGAAGFKMGPRQLFWLTRAGLLGSLGEVKLVNTLREDVIAQAVSLYLARQTGQWHSDMSASRQTGAIPYSREGILQALQTVAIDQYLVRYYVGLHGVDAITVTYEQLMANTEDTVREVLEFLDLPDCAGGTIDLSSVAIRRQATSHNKELADKFRTEFALSLR